MHLAGDEKVMMTDPKDDAQDKPACLSSGPDCAVCLSLTSGPGADHNGPRFSSFRMFFHQKLASWNVRSYLPPSAVTKLYSAEGLEAMSPGGLAEMFEFREGRYVVALWMVPLTNARDLNGVFYEQADWLATLYRDENESVFKCHYRFRYYVDEKAHDSEDKKSAYNVTFVGKTESEVLVIMGQFAENIAKPRAEIHKLMINSSDPMLISKRLQSEKFFHVKILKPDANTSEKS